MSEFSIPNCFWNREQRYSSRKECSIQQDKGNYMFLIPGMGATVRQLFPLCNSLRSNDEMESFSISAIPIGRSLMGFGTIVDNVYRYISSQIDLSCFNGELVLFGHSHGGRVATQLGTDILSEHSHVHVKIITAGTPIVRRPLTRSFIVNYLLSEAFRQWPEVSQPEMSSQILTALYSDKDEVVGKSVATDGLKGRAIKVDDLLHDDFVDPEKIIDDLLEILVEE